MKAILFALVLSSQFALSEERPRANGDAKFTPKTDIIYTDQKTGKKAYISCDGFWVNNKKERIFSVTLKDENGGGFSHSMDSRTLERELVCNEGFSLDEITEFRDVLCSAKNAISLSAEEEISYKKVMEASLRIAQARAEDRKKSKEDLKAVNSILLNQDPNQGDSRSHNNFQKSGSVEDKNHRQEVDKRER